MILMFFLHLPGDISFSLSLSLSLSLHVCVLVCMSWVTPLSPPTCITLQISAFSFQQMGVCEHQDSEPHSDLYMTPETFHRSKVFRVSSDLSLEPFSGTPESRGIHVHQRDSNAVVVVQT